MRAPYIIPRVSHPWTDRVTVCAVALATLLTSGCMEAELEQPAAVTPEDSLLLDSLAVTPVPANGEPRPAEPLTPDRTPVISRPASTTTTARDTGQVARAVFGTAEIQVDSTTFAPADYLRVLLQGERVRFETLTDRSGQFIFENVPAGRYELVFITATKDQRVVHRAPVTLEAGGKVALPAMHIPLRSLRVRGDGPVRT